MADGSIIINTKINQQGFKQGVRQLEKGFNSLKNSLKNLAVAAGLAFGTAAIVNFGKTSVKAATDLKNAMTGLKSIMDGQGRSFAVAKDFIDSYTKDGLIPATDAITAYKNLAARGYDTRQIEQTMLALKDSSAFGRQASLSMGEAVRTATEGLKNENSVLVDNAGVTKNVAKMWDEYAKSIGTTTNNLTQQQKIQAEVLGIMEETKFQTGDAAKVANSFSGQILQLQFSFNNLKIAIGNAIMPIAQAVLPQINAMVIGFTRLANVVAQFTTALFGKQVNTQKKIADTAISAAKAQDKLAQSTTKAGKAAKNSLMSFDELNVLQSDLTDEDTPSPLIDGGTELSDIDPLKGEIGGDIEISPKIQELADKIKNIFNSVKDLIKRYEPLLLGIGAGFLTAFGMAWVAKAITAFKKVSVITKGLIVIKKAVAAVALALTAGQSPVLAFSAGLKTLWLSFAAFMKSLSPMAKFAVAIAGIVATIVTVRKAIAGLVTGNLTLEQSLKNIVPIVGAVGIALYAMMGPMGLVVTALATLTGAVLGYSAGLEELLDKKIADMWHNDGVAISDVATSIEDLTNKMTETESAYLSNIENLNSIKSSASEVGDELTLLIADISGAGTITEEETTKIKNAFEDLATTSKKYIEESNNSMKLYILANKEMLEAQGISTQTLVDIINEGTENSVSKIDTIQARIKELTSKSSLSDVEITELSALQEQLLKLSGVEIDTTSIDNLKKSIEAYSEIDFESPEKLQEALTSISKNIAEAERDIADAKDGLLSQISTMDITDEQKQQLANSITSIFDIKESDLQSAIAPTVQKIKRQSEKMVTDIETGIAETLEKEWYKGLNPFKSYDDAFKEMSEKKIPSFLRNIDETMKTEAAKYGVKGSVIDKYLEYDSKKVRQNGIGAGQNLQSGVAQGISDYSSLPINSIVQSAKDTNVAYEKQQGINSPSRVYEGYGEFQMEGLANGLKLGMRFVISAISSIVIEMNNRVQSGLNPATFRNLGTNVISALAEGFESNKKLLANAVSNVFNAILEKQQEFTDKFSVGANGLLSSASIALSSSTGSSIQVKSIPKINIPKLARGGIIDSPTVAMVGEAGKEAVMPLENNTGWIDMLAGKLVAIMSLQSQGGNQPIINISLDGKELSYEIDKIQSNESLRGNGR